MNTRYLPRDHNTLDLYAEANPVFVEQCSEFASSQAIADRVPAREWTYYYGMLREAKLSEENAERFTGENHPDYRRVDALPKLTQHEREI